jgi:hypothetical protein
MKNQAAAIALSDYLAALEAMAVSQPATSLAGCMVQVALMNHMFNSCDPDPSVSDFSNQEATRRFEIAVYSVIGALSRETRAAILKPSAMLRPMILSWSFEFQIEIWRAGQRLSDRFRPAHHAGTQRQPKSVGTSRSPQAHDDALCLWTARPLPGDALVAPRGARSE